MSLGFLRALVVVGRGACMVVHVVFVFGGGDGVVVLVVVLLGCAAACLFVGWVVASRLMKPVALLTLTCNVLNSFGESTTRRRPPDSPV